jgi:DNA polymerase sigma
MSYQTSLLPNYLDTVILQKTDYYKNNTNLLELFGDFLEILKVNLDYEKAKSSGDFLKIYLKFMKN